MRRALLLLAALSCIAASAARNKALWDSAPAWVTRVAGPGTPAALDLDFADGWYFDGLGLNTFGRIAVTRASTEVEYGPDGTYFPFSSGQLAVTASGAWIWEARTNSIRNSVAGGASGGGAPTDWTLNTFNSVTQTTAATTVSSGVTLLPVTLAGTTGGAPNTSCAMQFDGAQVIAATYGQTWALSVFVTLSGTTVPTILLNIEENNSSGSGLTAHTVTISPTAAVARYSTTVTLTNTATAYAQPEICFTTAASTTYSGTIRVGWAQLEQNSNISSTVASASVASGGSGCLNGTDTFTVVGGTGTAATVSGTVTGGILGGTLTVVTAGSYSVFPPSPASTTGGTCTMQPTLTLAPTNLAADAFATSPILTTSAAATRAATVAALALPAGAMSTSGYSLLGIGTPMTPAGYSSQQTLTQTDDGTLNNRFLLYRLANGNVAAFTEAAGVASTVMNPSSAAWSVNASGKLVSYTIPGNYYGKFNGGTLTTLAQTGIPAITTMRIGGLLGGSGLWNGSIARLVVAPASMLNN
jgi:hypothetical protein